MAISRRSLGVAAFAVAIVIGAVAVAQGLGGPTPQRQLEAHGVERHPQSASPAQARSADAAAARVYARGKGKSSRPRLRSFVSDRIRTAPGSGTFVGVKCPRRYVAVSGGAINNFSSLTISSSAPNNPQTGRYTKGTWYVAMVNDDIDGAGLAAEWVAVVNCLSKVR